jgi:hypothetical protein
MLTYWEVKEQARELGIALTERVNTGRKDRKGRPVYRNHPKTKAQLLMEISEFRDNDG